MAMSFLKKGEPLGLKALSIPFLLVLAFGFRFYFGLHCPPTIVAEDEIQTYLIGLKSYTTGTWPYFGTDMQGGAGGYSGQMAGALEGLLIAIPLYIWPNPLAPYLFLNLLTFAAFTLLAWYCHKRVSGIPAWFIFAWVYFAPWCTHFSTVMINESYSIVGSVLFFLGFMESDTTLRRGLISVPFSNFLMGFGFCWVLQLHMSWVMFLPFLIYSFCRQWNSGNAKTALGFGGLGALLLLALLLPTYLVYGFSLGKNVLGYSSLFNTQNVLAFFPLLARFFSLACFELPRFIGANTHERLGYLLETPWLAASGFFLGVTGFLQVFALIVLWFFPKRNRSDWNAVKWMTLFFFLIIYFFFWFSAQPPTSYRYYEALPVVMIYSFYCWEGLAAKLFWRWFGVVFLAAAVFFQAGYALKTTSMGTSVYSQYRDRMETAIQTKNYHLLAERRPYALY
jgi:hypothetical protein